MTIVHIIFLEIILVFSFAFFFIYRTITKKEAFESKDFFILWYEKKERELERSESGITINTYIQILTWAPVALFIIICVLTQNGLFSIMGALFGILIPTVLVKVLESRNSAKFDERYARSLRQLASSLKAGMSILESVKDVAESQFVHPSMRKRYAAMALDLQMGVSVSDAFRNFADKINSKDARDTAIAIDVQNEVGGHEADVIEEIADNISHRIMLRKEIKTLFSGTTSMIYMMEFVPFIVILIYLLGNKEMANTYFSSPIMMIVLLILCCFLGIGSLINHRTLNKVMKGD